MGIIEPPISDEDTRRMPPTRAAEGDWVPAYRIGMLKYYREMYEFWKRVGREDKAAEYAKWVEELEGRNG